MQLAQQIFCTVLAKPSQRRFTVVRLSGQSFAEIPKLGLFDVRLPAVYDMYSDREQKANIRHSLPFTAVHRRSRYCNKEARKRHNT